ncbi:dethiobiotin synthase [Ferrimonas pelagia]|uniref:ATP-dependent dethiobiotin synthetase BioD n=1 Tax=Ferrimonas pelagia TaxID=1177826 RepID=A0ABP9EHD1_9GAMM
MIYFVAGTDTDVGKTWVSAALLAAAQTQGLSTLGLKPIAAGCEPTPQGLRNGDALALQAVSSVPVPYELCNPIALAPPIAPHVAAAESGQPLSVDRLQNWLAQPALRQAQGEAALCLVEGAGGWRLPLDRRHCLPDWVRLQGWPVVLVVGMKLGCLNHALLTAEAIRADGLTLAGWIANRIDPAMSHYQANIDTLQAMLGAPMLAEIPHLADGSDASGYLSMAVRHLIGQ